MKAKEMFEDLGYAVELQGIDDYDKEIKYQKNTNDYPSDHWIYFYKNKTYITGIEIDYQEEINIKLHNAIHQQLIELGWI
jgi:hypothetical protein